MQEILRFTTCSSPTMASSSYWPIPTYSILSKARYTRCNLSSYIHSGFPEMEVPHFIIYFNGILAYKPSFWVTPINGNPHIDIYHFILYIFFGPHCIPLKSDQNPWCSHSPNVFSFHHLNSTYMHMPSGNLLHTYAKLPFILVNIQKAIENGPFNPTHLPIFR